MATKKQNGFTLVELAIALMVIGLLIGGVLKGQELIENARITRTVKDINDYDTAVMIFRNTYNALPGDMKYPNRIPNCSEAPCNIAGDNNGIISPTFAKESLNVWWHLQKAGLISNINEEATYDHLISPPTPYGDGNHILLRNAETYTAPTGFAQHDPNENYFTFYGAGHENPIGLYYIDAKMDDGKASTGRVQIMKPAANQDTCFDTSTFEYLQDSNLKCKVKITSFSAN